MTHFQPLEADLARYYQLDLGEVLWGPEPISARRLAALVRGLPADGAVGHTAGPSQGWTLNDMLLAALVEAVDAGNGLFYAAHAREDAPPWDPITLRRPWEPEEPPAPKMSTPEELAAFFGGSVRYCPAEDEP